MLRPPQRVRKFSNPDFFLQESSLNILGMAKKTGSHLCSFHTALIRMPIKKTTKSPSILAVFGAVLISVIDPTAKLDFYPFEFQAAYYGETHMVNTVR